MTQTAGAAGAAGAPNSLIGGGVSAPLTASANSGPAVTGVTFAFNAVSAGAVTQTGAGAAGAAGAPNSLIGGGVSAPLTASANSGPALIGVTFAFNAVSRWRSDPERGTGAAGAAGAPNSLIGGGVSAPLTASANSGPALIGVTFAFNAVSAGAVTQTGAAGRPAGAAGAPNSLIGGGVSAPLTASANSGPALIGVTFAFNAVSRWRSDPERGRGRRRRRGTQLAHRRRRIRTAYGVCQQRPGPDRSDLCV